MATLDDVKAILDSTLGIGLRAAELKESSPLLGAIPELDSMAVVNIIATIESHFGIAVADDEISADTFATLGALSDFVNRKLG